MLEMGLYKPHGIVTVFNKSMVSREAVIIPVKLEGHAYCHPFVGLIHRCGLINILFNH